MSPLASPATVQQMHQGSTDPLRSCRLLRSAERLGRAPPAGRTTEPAMARPRRLMGLRLLRRHGWYLTRPQRYN